jgi:hypothetical protein
MMCNNVLSNLAVSQIVQPDKKIWCPHCEYHLVGCIKPSNRLVLIGFLYAKKKIIKNKENRNSNTIFQAIVSQIV